MNDYLKECLNCLNFIPLKAAKCSCCNSFQMHIDYRYLEKKMEGFEGLSELRYATREKINEMAGRFDKKEIKLFSVQQQDRQDYFKIKLMSSIEKDEPFMLN